MMKVALLVVCLSLPAAFAAEWALLVAGSNGYYNYRHQADVCHSYKLLIANGFPADHIVTMFYDDIAYDSENPVQGNLINQPDGPNVYEGCVGDYTGMTVTPKNFLKILQGEDMGKVGTGRTIQSTSDDTVFVFFSDHGATGLIAFPSDELYADDLNKAIITMHANKQYKQLLFYLEACESGSMFDSILANDLNVLAVTASDPNHSSYAIYFDSTRNTYLGDVFSVYWMQDTEAHNPAQETIKKQFNIVHKETNTSTTCAYGDQSIMSETLSIFIGSASTERTMKPLPAGEMVDSRDVTRRILEHRVSSAHSAEARSAASTALSMLVKSQAKTDLRMNTLALGLTGRNATAILSEVRASADECHASATRVSDFSCLKQMVKGWESHCGRLDDYGLKHVAVLNTICNAGVNVDASLTHVQRVCAAF